MTNREFYIAIANNEALTEEIRAHATAEIEKLDARNAKRAEKPSKTAVANEPIKANIVKVLEDGGKTASDIATALEISVQKASALCRQLADAGQVTATEVKVPKKGKQKLYTLAVVVGEVEAENEDEVENED